MKRSIPSRKEKSLFLHYLAVVIVVVSVSAVCFLFKDTIGYRLVSFILLFVVSILAVFFGTGTILLASTLIVSLLNGILTSRIRRQELNAREREERTLALYQLSKELLTANGLPEVVRGSVSPAFI